MAMLVFLSAPPSHAADGGEEAQNSGMDFFASETPSKQTEEPREHVLPPGASSGLLFECKPVGPPPGFGPPPSDSSSPDSSPDFISPSPSDEHSAATDDGSTPGSTSRARTLGDIQAGDVPAGETVPDDALQGFVDIVNRTKRPELHPESASMDGVQAKLDAMVKQDDVSLESSATMNTLNAKKDTTKYSAELEAKRRAISKAISNFGTMTLYLRALPVSPWIVIKPYAGGGADLAGVKAGDQILEVDGRPATGLNMTIAYHRLTGRRGQIKYLKIRRGSSVFTLPVRLISIYEIRNRDTQYIEYYWYLLYNGIISPYQFKRMIKPFI